MNGRAIVYKSTDNCYFSVCVTRDFGENKVIRLFSGESILCCVMPLKCEPLANNLSIVGTANRDSGYSAMVAS